MAAKRTFRMFVEEELGEFPHFVVWAVLEWTLIVSLYLDGFFSFVSKKFARIFELDPPCVLCTRVDHALGGKNPNSFYNESICDSHKKDISSLAYCHVHRKLSDIRNMCEGCLLSFATEKESDDDEVKADDDDQKTSGKRDPTKGKDSNKNDKSIDTNRCSCCGESLKPKQPSKELSRSFSNLRNSSLMSSNSPRASGLKASNSPRALAASVLAAASPRVSSSLFPNSSPRASSSLFATSPRVSSSLFPTSSPRASSSLIPTSSPRASSSLFPSSSPRSSLFPSSSPRASLFPTSSPRASSSLFPTSSPRASWRLEESRNAESQARYSEIKFASDNEPDEPLDANSEQNKDLKPDYDEINEDFIKTPSYIKGNKFFGIPLNETIANSPRWANKPPKKAIFDKPESSSESVDESSTADGCSILQQLKKQVSDNRKTLVTLYMELDEERSAAAVAANNAMAMITRLQAEKAAIHMEALQYQRMMDEQAEYDEEAIQILRDLYLKKEDDVRALEIEVDVYKDRYGEISKPDSDGYDEYYDEFQPRSFDEKSDGGSGVEDQTEEETSSNFESERSQLFGMLKDFENRVYSSSSSHPKDHHEDHDTCERKDDALRKEVTLMREKLAAIEAESGFLKQTAMALEKGDEGTKLLTEIAEHLRNLNGSNGSSNY